MRPEYYIKQYEQSCNLLGNYFAQRYFGKDYEQWWVADDVTGTMYINDRFFSVLDMYQYIKHKYTAEQMFKRYDDEIEYDLRMGRKDGFPNIENYKKLNK
jgi:hypothetical protein